MPRSPQEPTGAPPTASDGSQAIGSASKHDYDICAVNEILLASEQRAYRAERRVGELLQAVGARQSEARQAREAMQSLDVFYTAERERLTASLTALRGALETMISEMRNIAIVAGQFSVEGPEGTLSFMAAAEADRASRWADQLSTALAVSRVPQDDKGEK